jgi:hypothetical protein
MTELQNSVGVVSGGNPCCLITRMADEFPFLPGTAREVPGEPQPLWEVQGANGHSWAAPLRYHGDWGIEAQLFRGGSLVIGRVLKTRADAVAWANEQSADVEKGSTAH